MILASASPRRRQLLQQLGLSFTVLAADIDEAALVREGELSPVEQALHLAELKARAVQEQLKEGLIIAADTVVWCGDHALGKPSDNAEARRMLQMLSGRAHLVVTGLCLMDCVSGVWETAAECTEVFFRELTAADIEAYIATGEPHDKAGAYGIQGYGAIFVEAIAGCYYNVMGLPLNRLCRMLGNFGVSVL